MNEEHVVPDMATFAKALTNGVCAMGALVGKSEILTKATRNTIIYSTLGWTPVACAAAIASMNIHGKTEVWKEGKRKGSYMQKVLHDMLGESDGVIDVRGKGMLVGIELAKVENGRISLDQERAAKVVHDCLDRGLHITLGDTGMIQLMPPLIIRDSVLEKGLDMLICSVKNQR
jgi:4-aminobutyrate aminotransferase